MPTIAIDHDGTYTLAPQLWDEALEVFKRAGFKIVCITSRFPDCPLPPNLPFPVYYACGEPKWEFAHRRGIEVDIWIDDTPYQIGEHPQRRGDGWPQRDIRRQYANHVIDQIANQMTMARV